MPQPSSKWYGYFERVVESDKYGPAEVRDEKDWVVVLHNRTYLEDPRNKKSQRYHWFNFRLFPTLERIEYWYGDSIWKSNVFVNPRQLVKAMDEVEMFEFWKYCYLQIPAKTSLLKHLRDTGQVPRFIDPLIIPKSLTEMADDIWRMIQEKADRVTRVKPGAGDPEHQNVYVIRIDRLKEKAEDVAALPRQCRIIAQQLLEAGKGAYTVDEMTQFMRNLVIHKKLKTKQDAMLVFQYYAPKLGDLNLVYYEGKRHKQEDFEDAGL
jgi:hypothetical protein